MKFVLLIHVQDKYTACVLKAGTHLHFSALSFSFIMLISLEDDFLITSGPGLHCLLVSYEWYATQKAKKFYLSGH